MDSRRRFAERYSFLRWLAVPFAAVGAVFGFFALVWTEIPQAVFAVVFLGVAALIWMVFAARRA